MSLPKISIITPSFNQAPFIEETLRSVLGQCYSNLEYIVIDGGSKDGSADIIKRYEQFLYWWVSEDDRGQVHAINKGLAKATGEIVAFLNSDDLYLPGAFNAVVEYFQANPQSRWLCGDTIFFGKGHPATLFNTVVPKSAVHALSWEAHCPQPGMFWKRELLIEGFQERWNYCFDHDLYVRLLLAGYKCDHLPLPLAAYRLHQASKTVKESSEFDKEFDAIAELYEPLLENSGRRKSAATRFLRRSYEASKLGNAHIAFSLLIRSIMQSPLVIARRPFWGGVNMAIHSGLNQARRSFSSR